MHLLTLNCTDFRNYPALTAEFPPGGAVIHGSNGSGKTNLLEAIHLLCTGRSQRGATRPEMVRHNAAQTFIEGAFVNAENRPHDICTIGFGRSGRAALARNGKSMTSLAEWFGQCAIVCLGPGDNELIYGSAQGRRTYLDMTLCQIDRMYLSMLGRYRSLLEQKNRLLCEQGTQEQLEIYEIQMADCGYYISARRAETISRLAPFFAESYAQISAGHEAATVQLKPSILCDSSSENDWKNVFFTRLKDARQKERAIGFSTIGPHRDDLIIELDNKAAKQFGSQGQCRSCAIAIKVAAVQLLEQCRHRETIICIDDALAELDPQRSRRVYPLVSGKGQLFVTTPLDQLPEGLACKEFRIHNGAIVA